MEVTDKLVENLADLSRLSFSGAEKEGIKKDLEKMIAFIDKLNELDTTGVEPLLYVSDTINVYRDDTPQESMNRKEALANAPQTDDTYFMVPKVIRK